MAWSLYDQEVFKINSVRSDFVIVLDGCEFQHERRAAQLGDSRRNASPE